MIEGATASRSFSFILPFRKIGLWLYRLDVDVAASSGILADRWNKWSSLESSSLKGRLALRANSTPPSRNSGSSKIDGKSWKAFSVLRSSASMSHHRRRLWHRRHSPVRSKWVLWRQYTKNIVPWTSYRYNIVINTDNFMLSCSSYNNMYNV